MTTQTTSIDRSLQADLQGDVQEVSLHFFPRKSVFEILAELSGKLRDCGLASAIVGSRLSITGSWQLQTFPHVKRIMCSVSGNTQGHYYVHVDVLDQGDAFESLYVGRVIGADKAWEIARACANILNA